MRRRVRPRPAIERKLTLVRAGVLLAAWGVASRARAQAPEPVRVEVSAPAECTTEPAFFDAVRGRTPRVRLASSSETPAHIIRVRLERRPHLTSGELVLVDSKGGATHRHLAGDTCDIVVAGLAWVAARAIDPEATFAPVAAPAPLPAPAPPVPVPMPAPVPAHEPPAVPESPDVDRGVGSEAREDARKEETAGEDTPAAPPARWRLSIGAGAGTFNFKVPGLVPDVAGFADVALDSPKLFAPSLRLALHHTPQSQDSDTQTSAEFTWTFARADACPLRLAPVRTLSFRPCAFLDAGALAADGGAVGTSLLAGSHVRAWFATGALGRVEWTLLDPIVLEAEGGVLVALTRDNFQSAPVLTVYEAPAALPFASLGFAGRFP